MTPAWLQRSEILADMRAADVMRLRTKLARLVRKDAPKMRRPVRCPRRRFA